MMSSGTSYYTPYFNPMDFIGPLISLIVLAFIIGIIFIFVKAIFGGSKNETKYNSARRGYYYLVSFMTLSVVYFSFNELLSLVLTALADANSAGYSYDTFARAIALRTATLLVSLPVFAYHWMVANKKLTMDDQEVRQYEINQRRSYVQLILVIATLILLVVGARFLYLGMLLALGVSGASLASFFYPLAYTLGTSVLWGYHLMVLRETK